MHPLISDHLTPPMQIISLLCGGFVTQAVHAMAELRLADLVQEGPKSTSELAKATKTHEKSLYRLLRVLVCLDLLSEPQPGYYGPTALSACLLSDSQKTLYHLALMVGGDWPWKILGELSYSLHTGKPAFDHLYGKSIWQYFAENDLEAGTLFNLAIKSGSRYMDESIVDAYDFSSIHTLVDVGGGLGSLLMTVLQRYPMMKGILFDRPEVIEEAREQIERAGLSSRCELIPGNFFEEIPRGDAYCLRQIILDWEDKECEIILRNCKQAMNPGGKILVIEQVLQLGKVDLVGKLLDLHHLCTLLGRQREEAELCQLFAAAELTLKRVISTNSLYKIIEGAVA